MACITGASRRHGRRHPPSRTEPSSSIRPLPKRWPGRRVGQVRTKVERRRGGRMEGESVCLTALSFFMRRARPVAAPLHSPHASHAASTLISALYYRRPIFNRAPRRRKKTDCSCGSPSGWPGWFFCSTGWDGGRSSRRRRSRRGHKTGQARTCWWSRRGRGCGEGGGQAPVRGGASCYRAARSGTEAGGPAVGGVLWNVIGNAKVCGWAEDSAARGAGTED